jgi:hypothetical protein
MRHRADRCVCGLAAVARSVHSVDEAGLSYVSLSTMGHISDVGERCLISRLRNGAFEGDAFRE